MTQSEQIVRDINTLKESIGLDRMDILAASTDDDRARIRNHLKWCLDELGQLIYKLDQIGQ